MVKDEVLEYSLVLQRKLAEETSDTEVIEEIMKSKNHLVLISLSTNKHLNTEQLKSLVALSQNNIVMRNVAKHKNVDGETLDKLSKGNHRATIEAIAENPAARDSTLQYIMSSKASYSINGVYLVNSIYQNPSASEETKKKALKFAQCVCPKTYKTNFRW